MFGDPRPLREVVNALNVMAVENDISKLPVYVLKSGLNFKDIFLFFIEVTKLIKECPFDSATPYPLDKNKTPTVFICRKEVKKCPYIDPNRKAVKLVKPLGEPAVGDYSLCRLLTPKRYKGSCQVYPKKVSVPSITLLYMRTAKHSLCSNG